MIGQVVGQYKILEKLGEGGMGTVFKGMDLMVEREVAIKMLRPEIARQPELVERFRSEAVTLAKLNNPGIATLFNFFRQGDDFFMVMEFVSGRTLDQALRESGPMPVDRAVPLFERILECIQPAHNAGILHRDIKPANIMLTTWGGVKVMDFGIARVLGSARMTREGRMVGTIEYIAPERIKGNEADVQSDIYSLGVVFYEMLSGRLPFESQSEFEIMRGHVQEAPPPFGKHGRDIPPALEAVVMKSLAKAPEDRFQNCPEFILALQSAMPSLPPRITDPNLSFPQPQTLKATVMSSPAQSFVTAEMPGFEPERTGQYAAAAAKATRYEPEVKATKYEPQPEVAMPQPGTVQQITAKRSPFANLNWKHYAAAGVVLAVLLAGGLFAFLGGNHPAPQNAIAQPDKAPESAAPVSPNPPTVAADPGGATGVAPTAAIDAGKGDQPVAAAPAYTLNPNVAPNSDEAKAKERAEAQREAARRKQEALKALDQ